MEIEFPASSQPSRNVTENGGRLINAYAEAAPAGSRSKIIIRRAPGLLEEFTVGTADHRGSIAVGNILYVVNGDKCYSVVESGGVYTITQLTGTVAGEGRITLARNMATTANVLAVTTDGVTQITSSAVSDFSDPDLPSPTSIDYIDGYFMFAIADGKCFASGVNNTNIAGTDFATAEALPDGLRRGVAAGRDLLLMGENSIEIWNNTGNATGFPFSRTAVLPVGLLDKWCVAGQEDGWPGSLTWVGNDRRVYRLNGYEPVPISTKHIERMLGDIIDTSELDAHVYVSAGKPCWVLSSNSWTWVYDVSTSEWHERKSYNRSNWRTRFGVNAFDKWLTFDRDTGKGFSIADKAYKEGTDPLVWEVVSKQAHNFPSRVQYPRASFDLVTTVGVDQGVAPIETNPVVSIDWSDDGGRTFSHALLRELGATGEIKNIDLWRTGLSGRLGRQWRLRASDPVEISFLGGATDARGRKA